MSQMIPEEKRRYPYSFMMRTLNLSQRNELVEKYGAKMIHPSQDFDVIAGQGTIGVELIEQFEEQPLDAIIIPVGGGGLISGIAT